MLELFILILAGHRAFVAAIRLQSIGTLFLNWNNGPFQQSIIKAGQRLKIMLMFVSSFNVLMHQNEGINLYIKETSINPGKNTNDQNNNSLHLTARAIKQFHIERTLRSSYCILFLSQSIALILIYKKEKTVHIQWTRHVFSFLTS